MEHTTGRVTFIDVGVFSDLHRATECVGDGVVLELRGHVEESTAPLGRRRARLPALDQATDLREAAIAAAGRDVSFAKVRQGVHHLAQVRRPALAALRHGIDKLPSVTDGLDGQHGDGDLSPQLRLVELHDDRSGFGFVTGNHHGFVRRRRRSLLGFAFAALCQQGKRSQCK